MGELGNHGGNDSMGGEIFPGYCVTVRTQPYRMLGGVLPPSPYWNFGGRFSLKAWPAFTMSPVEAAAMLESRS